MPLQRTSSSPSTPGPRPCCPPAWGLFVLIVLGLLLTACRREAREEFLRLSNEGRKYYEHGDAARALGPFEQALALEPANTDARLNLANALLAANRPAEALAQAQAVLQADPGSAAAHFIAGCAHLRLGQPRPASQALQEAKRVDVTVNAVTYQLGRAYQQLGQFAEAAQEFEELLQFETNHLAAHYNLSQVLQRLGRTDEATEQLAIHQRLIAAQPGQTTDPSTLERCVYTQARVPFRLQQPDRRGIRVAFADVTAAALGPGARQFRGPATFIDPRREGRNHLFVTEGAGFRFLENSNGVFHPTGDPFAGLPEAGPTRCLAGDLNNDRADDVLVLGAKGVQLFKFATNGTVTDLTLFSKLKGFAASEGVLVDLDFTGKLDLLAGGAGADGVRVLRNLGHPYFVDNTTNSGVPPGLADARQLLVEDWNNDDLLDLFIVRPGQAPLLLVKQRGGALAPTNLLADLPPASALATGDLDNDLRSDLVAAVGERLLLVFNGPSGRASLPLGQWPVASLLLLDYDNDGWLDVLAAGPGLRVWRNLGQAGFKETTAELGLGALGREPVASMAAADIDQDGDTDLLLTRPDRGLLLLRNDGGHAHHQLKVQLTGTKSNVSGLGIRLDVTAGSLRLSRRVSALPVEIGVGRNAQVDSVTAHWFDFSLNNVDVKPDPKTPLALLELKMDTGSCPYFYAWDGNRFRFVTDLLGAAPVGLPISEGRYVEADPEEYVWIGNETMFPPRGADYVLQITEELREVLYLDEARLVVVDHPPGTEVHTTGKMVPGRPFPPHQIVTLHRRLPLRHAENHTGAEVTPLLQEADGRHVSPLRLRLPHLKGLAEPSSVTLDFGPLPVDRPLVLALTGWLRFGGGMANMAAARDPGLPFPFPKLEVERDGQWQSVDVTVGVPAGKTKRIVVDLAGKLPPGSRRLRLSTAYELHWDRIALFEKRDQAGIRIRALAPTRTDLHWRGYCEKTFEPWDLPSTPDYEKVFQVPSWRLAVSGWCTRYGPVDDLVAASDNAFALLNGGDELTLFFATNQVPAKPAGAARDFFLYSVGWDKDADFHCKLGWQVEPLPWHGMDDQRYGEQPRPAFPADALMERYNTRWVGPRPLARRQ